MSNLSFTDSDGDTYSIDFGLGGHNLALIFENGEDASLTEKLIFKVEDAERIAAMILDAAKKAQRGKEQAEADEAARIQAQVTGSRGATYIIKRPGQPDIVGRYSRCVEWDYDKQTICGIETTHTPCPDHPAQEG